MPTPRLLLGRIALGLSVTCAVATVLSGVALSPVEIRVSTKGIMILGVVGALFGSPLAAVLAIIAGQKSALKVAAASFAGSLLVAYVFVSAPADRYWGPGDDMTAISFLRTLNTAEVTYRDSSGKYGTLKDLVDAGLVDARFTQGGRIHGYRLFLVSDGKSYTATAEPAGTRSEYGYYSGADAVVRYSAIASLAPRNQAGNAVQ